MFREDGTCGDVPVKGMLDQDKENTSNQEIKALSLLFKELPSSNRAHG